MKHICSRGGCSPKELTILFHVLKVLTMKNQHCERAGFGGKNLN